MTLSAQRIVAVHAHPDDESITMAGTLHRLARLGHDVTVITCTLGEEGEVIGEELAELVVDEADQLGGYRIGELRRALDAIGVRGEFLGAPGRYRDSGMVGSPASRKPRALVNNWARSVDDLVAALGRLDPTVLLTYGPDGGYGHPDHIRVHEMTHEAARRAGIETILWVGDEREWLDARLAEIRAIPEGWRHPAEGELWAVRGHDIAVTLSEEELAVKVAALRAHRTQVTVADAAAGSPMPIYALSNLIAQPVRSTEFFRVGAGERPSFL